MLSVEAFRAFGKVISRRMGSLAGDFLPPLYKKDDRLLGITQLVKEDFEQTITYPCLCIPSSLCEEASRALKKYFLKVAKFKAVKDIDENKKLILFDPSSVSDKCVVDFISQRKLELEERDFSIGYENLTFQQVSNLVLPDNRSLSGFSIVGHIAHFNLREEHLPFRHLLGQVVVDKIPVIKTVVNKTQIIGSSEFRNFNFEIIAGETNTVTELVEHGVKFRLDFSKVYWNSRLSREHQRIVNKLSRNDILIDPFCGIGPFALPAAKKGCKVFANDLNPDAVEWLKKNVEVNKIRSECIDIFNMDAGEFVTLIVSEKLTEKILKECKSFHVTMNLPGTGYNFLPFLECLKNAEMLKHAVFVHFYCFTQKETMECESLQFIREAFRLSVDEIQLRGKISFHEVRAVSTNKIMMCLSFDLLDILPPTLTDDEAKRIKLDCEPSQ